VLQVPIEHEGIAPIQHTGLSGVDEGIRALWRRGQRSLRHPRGNLPDDGGPIRTGAHGGQSEKLVLYQPEAHPFQDQAAAIRCGSVLFPHADVPTPVAPTADQEGEAWHHAHRTEIEAFIPLDNLA
jgi:hypothetical protein